MGIRRTALPFEKDYVQIPNAWLRDATLSRRARGLLAELMTHRAGWHITIAGLQRTGPEGRDAIRSAVQELVKRGYLVRRQTQGEGGRFNEIEYEISDPTAVGKPDTGGFTDDGPADDGSADVGEPATKKTISQNIIEVEHHQEEEHSSAPAARNLEPDFNRAWVNWPKRVERKKSLAAFITATKTRPVDQLVADIIRFGDAYAATTEKQFVPALCVWLNGERWTDELPTGRPAERAMQTVAAGSKVKKFRAHPEDVPARTFGQQRQENALALVARYQQEEQAAEFPPGHAPTDAEWNALLSDPKPQGTPGPPRMSELTSSYCAEHLGYPIINGVCDKCEQIRQERGAA